MTIRSPIDLAFLGCGFATRLHSRTLSRLALPVRRHYASRELARAKEFQRKYGGHSAFDSYEAAIQSSQIDVVMVATPPAHHLELALQALRAGKDVIVEKPPFLRSADFDAVRQAQDETGRRVLVAENYFYKPLAEKLRELLAGDAIGEVLFLNVNALKQQRSDDWRDEPELAGGGALFEGGIHWINFMANLGFEVDTVVGFCPGDPARAERSVLAAFRYAEGPVGTLFYSWEVPGLFKGLRLSKIYGRQGSITFESNGVIVLLRGRKKRIYFPGFRDISGYRAMLSDFVDALLSGRQPQMSLAIAQRDLELVETIYASLGRKKQLVRGGP